MGKRRRNKRGGEGGGRRRRNDGGGRRGEGHVSSSAALAVAPSVFSVGGIVDPAYLARRAAEIEAAASSSSFSRGAASAEEDGRNKRRRRNLPPERDDGGSDGAGLAVRRDGKRRMSKDAPAPRAAVGASPSPVAGGDDSPPPGAPPSERSPPSSSRFTFGRPRWRRTEQLAHVLLVPNRLLLSSRDGGVVFGPTTTAKVTFVRSAGVAKSLSGCHKATLRPWTSAACHGASKRGQTVSTVLRVVDEIDSRRRPSGVTATTECEGSGGFGPALFVADESLGKLSSVLEEIASTRLRRRREMKKGEGDKKGRGKGKGERGRGSGEAAADSSDASVAVVGVHFHPSATRAILDSRRRILESISRLLLLRPVSSSTRDDPPARPTTPPPATEVLLDGTTHGEPDDDGGRNRSDDNDLGRSLLHFDRTLASAVPTSDRPAMQAIVNAASKAYASEPGSPKHRAAMDRLRVHLAVLRSERKSGEGVDDGGVEGRRSPKAESAATTLKKMKVLRMIHDTCDAATGGKKSIREAALTRWLDGADGAAHGGEWKGPIRQGASAERASRELATLVRRWKEEEDGDGDERQLRVVGGGRPNGGGAKGSNDRDAFSALARWRPNPSNGDDLRTIDDGNDLDDDDGGRRDFGDDPCGKACGHNEATMFYLRPYAPLEVLNSRVCSKASPAPGNDGGHEGCLEYLRRICAQGRRGVAYWDSECFAYVNGDGSGGRGGWGGGGERRGREAEEDSLEMAQVHRLEKKDLLCFSLEQLAWLMPAMRQWTLFRETITRTTTKRRPGGYRPSDLIGGIDLVRRLAVRGSGDDVPSRFPPAAPRRLSRLPRNALLRVASFILPGTMSEWRSLGSMELK